MELIGRVCVFKMHSLGSIQQELCQTCGFRVHLQAEMGIQPAELLIPVDKRCWKLVKTVKAVKTTKRGLQLFRFLQSPPAFGVYPPPRLKIPTTTTKTTTTTTTTATATATATATTTTATTTTATTATTATTTTTTRFKLTLQPTKTGI